MKFTIQNVILRVSRRKTPCVFNKLLIKCPNDTKPVLKNFWLPASFFFEHSKFGKGSLCYITILHFLLSFMCDFILLLVTKEVIQRDRCTIASEHTSYVLLMCIQFRLFVSNIFHKCSECDRVRAPRFKNHATVQKSFSSGRSSGISAFHSSKVISKLYFTNSYER